MINREEVYTALSQENAYAQEWNRSASGYDPGNDQRWGLMDWIVFAEKYLNDAKAAWAGYTPDRRAVTIRILKAANLLVTGLSSHCSPEEIASIAGVSSNQFPIYRGGLQDKRKESNDA